MEIAIECAIKAVDTVFNISKRCVPVTQSAAFSSTEKIVNSRLPLTTAPPQLKHPMGKGRDKSNLTFIFFIEKIEIKLPNYGPP